MQELNYNGQTIHIRDGDMLSLTDMWRAADCPKGKEPWEWARYAGKEWIDFIAENLNLGRAQVVKTSRGGRQPGTWAHWQIGFAYAKHLSHEFHAWCNDVVRRHMEALAKQDEIRTNRITSRKFYAAAFFAKKGDRTGIAMGTNALYGAFFNGKTAKQLKTERGLKKHESLRDNMRLSTQMAVALAETLAGEHIAEMPKSGNEACIAATAFCATQVKKAVIAVRDESRTLEITA